MSRREMGTEEIARLVCQLAALQNNEDPLGSDKVETTRTYRNATEAVKVTYIYNEAPLEVLVRQRADIADNNIQKTNRAIISIAMQEYTNNCAQENGALHASTDEESEKEAQNQPTSASPPRSLGRMEQ
eukprot:gene4716-9358_t